MMKWYSIDPIPVKRRVRVTKQGHAYTDKKTKEDLKRIAKVYDGPLYTGAVALMVYVYKGRKMRKGASLPFTQTPDIDNVVKAIQDGLNGRAYLDDKQITKVYAVKLDRTSIAGEWCDFTVMPADELNAVIDGEVKD